MAEQTTTVTFTTNTTQAAPPAGQLRTHRGLLRVLLLSIVTLGIYALVFFAGVGNDLNTIASRYDDKKTMNHWLLALVVGPLTLGIGFFVWSHNLAKRIGKELRRRGYVTTFGAKTYWLWSILGLFFVAGPFIYMHKLCTAMNKLAKDYNEKG